MFIGIRNGIPYDERPQGDLISRGALKEKIQEIVETEMPIDEKWAIGLRHSLKLIDNAQTVELCYQTTSCLDCKNYDKENHNCPRYCEVIKDALEETKRPQGEWLHREEYTNDRPFYIAECPFCKLRVQEETNYCSNCGASMKGGDTCGK